MNENRKTVTSKVTDARTSVELLLNEMKPILLAAGVPKYQIHMRSGRHKISTCNTAFDWLHHVKISPEYAAMVYVWGLLPEEVWERYEKFGLTDTREQLMLISASKDLLKLWKKSRPRLFGKNRVKDNPFIDNASFESCRP